MPNKPTQRIRLIWGVVLALAVSVALTACNLLLSDPTSPNGDRPSPSNTSTVAGENGNPTTEPASPADPWELTEDTDSNNTTGEGTVPQEPDTQEEPSIQEPHTQEEPTEDESHPAIAPSDTEFSTACPHVSVTVPATPPTCLTSGKTEGSKCGTCGEVLKPQDELPATGHSFSPEHDYKCVSCGLQASCPAPVLNIEGDKSLPWGETLTLSWQFAEEPAFSTVCMVTAVNQSGLPVDLWGNWKPSTSYSRSCKQDGEVFTLRVYACYAVDGEPVSATQSVSADVTVTVSTREALESPGFIMGNRITVTPKRDVTVAWGSVTESGSRVVYDVLLTVPDGSSFFLLNACAETVCTVPASYLTAEGTYSLQVIARDENEIRRDSPPASIEILVTSPPSVEEQDYTNPTRYASDYFYNYLATQKNGEGLRGFYRLLDTVLSDFHRSSRSAETVQVSGGKAYYYAAKLDFTPFDLTLEEAASVRALYLLDHPLYYWMSNSYVYTSTTLYVCVDTAYATGKARAHGNELVYSGVASMAESVGGIESPYRIALAYYEKLLARADYAYEEDGTTPQDDLWAHSIMGVFDPNRKQVVCEGFAKTYSLLLNYHGVENIPVIGESRGVGHMWNLLRLDDGEWYWCDITWDDRTHSPLGTDYKYFCVTDTQDVLFYYMRDGIEAGLSYTFGDPATFMDDHTVQWGLGPSFDMSNVLPPRAEAPFDGTGFELRDTFTVDGMVYAKTGFGKVQLVDVGSRRSVTVAESVTYEGITYTVASIGLINSEGVYMKGRLLPLFASSVYIPKTVSYIWDNALSGLLVSITVDPENPWYVSENGNVKPKS